MNQESGLYLQVVSPELNLLVCTGVEAMTTMGSRSFIGAKTSWQALLFVLRSGAGYRQFLIF